MSNEQSNKDLVTANISLSILFSLVGLGLIITGFVKGKSPLDAPDIFNGDTYNSIIYVQQCTNMIFLGIGTIPISIVWALFAIIIKMKKEADQESDN